MAQVNVKYNPYRLRTEIEINGRAVEKDSTLYKLVKGKRLQEWISKFPKMLVEELNSVDFDIRFYGMDLDWDDFCDAFKHAEEREVIRKAELKFIEADTDNDITEKIVRVFTDLKEGPIEDFRDPRLLKAFENINNSVFPINVIATMSSGKSTLINALLNSRLMPSKNEACTATITEILDTDEVDFQATVYDEEDNEIAEVENLTYEDMVRLNEDDRVYRISAQGNVPFLDSRSTALMLVDTPGPNNARNQAHKNTTYRAINNDSNNLILYVLNGTQLSTNDDAALLNYVAEQMRKGGKQVRDRFLFVINKMDGFNPEEEDIGKAVQSAKDYLSSYGIEDPQIFPCSAYTALNIRTYFKDVDIDNLTRNDEKKLPSAARDTLPMIDKFVEYDSMHLEQYSTLSPSAQRGLNYRLKQAEEKGNTKEQALIHCGICSIEAAITAYVKKYAKTKKVKDLVESFQEVLDSNQVLVRVKTQVVTDEEAARKCEKRAATVLEKIADGKEAEKFKNKIEALDPMDNIRQSAEELKEKASRETSKIFQSYGDVIQSREEAERLVRQFISLGSDAIAELSADLESIINREIIETGETLLQEYQEKLMKFDETSEEEQLDFSTVDLIKGKLMNMRETVESWKSDEFAAETVEEQGEVTYETREYYEKVGEEEEEIVVGSHEEKIGTKKVKVGSHKEKVGTRSVKNPSRRGFFGFFKFWEPKYIEEDVYENVDDYKEEDVYKTVLDYKTIMRDIFERREEKIEKFTVEVKSLQTGLIMRLRKNLDEGIEGALGYGEETIQRIKEQFTKMFAELDEQIKEKYEELEKCASDKKTKEAELQKNKKLLGWIEACKQEIDEILDM